MYTVEETAPDALCVLRNKVLPDISVLPTKLHTHRDTSHPYYKDKCISFLQYKLVALIHCQSLTVKFKNW
jgi:hypothetical protein